MESFASRAAVRAAQVSPVRVVLAVLLFPLRVVGFVAALVWLVLVFAWSAVAQQFAETVARGPVVRGAKPTAGET